MKFKKLEDCHQFLIEVNRIDLVNLVNNINYEPTNEQMTSFIKSRKSIIPKLKSFRKSQAGKDNWRKNRYSMMKGIKSWHKSTDGKKFHRKLGRYLATRDFRPNLANRNKEESFEINLNDISETLKALSSLVTHFYIELDYYSPVNERVDLEILLEESHQVIRRVEDCLLNLKSVDEEDLDFVSRLVIKEDLISELSEVFNKSTEEVSNLFESELKLVNLEESGSYLKALDKTRLSLISK